MKIFRTSLLIGSILLIPLYLLNIVDTYISLKYEIDEPSIFWESMKFIALESYAYQMIFVLFWMMCYIALVMIYLTRTKHRD